MLSRIKHELKYLTPPRSVAIQLSVFIAMLVMFTSTAVAEDGDLDELQDTLSGIVRFIQVIVLGVAVPNGAYGFLQYMTAGSNVDKDEKGRKRIRNTFIALAGVAVIEVAVQAFDGVVGVTD